MEQAQQAGWLLAGRAAGAEFTSDYATVTPETTVYVCVRVCV